MARFNPFPVSAAVQDEAAAWVAREEHGLLEPEAARERDAWLETSPAHRAAYDRYRDLWAELGEAAPHLAGVAASPDQEQFASAAAGAQPRRRASGWRPMAAAAALVLLAGSTAWLTLRPAAIPEYRTEIGEQRMVTLADGSRVTLNTATALSAELEKDRRIISLDRGEALFEVAHDPARPFIVVTPAGSVRAVGTRFVVRLDGRGKLTVIVTEGKVLVSRAPSAPSAAPASQLVAGDEINLADSGAPTLSRLASDALAEELAWRQGDIVFDGESLAEAARELQRYTNRRIEVDPAVAAYSLGGRFRTNDIDAFAQTVESVFPVKVVRSPDSLKFVPSG